jgi:hypothetical protein
MSVRRRRICLSSKLKQISKEDPDFLEIKDVNPTIGK